MNAAGSALNTSALDTSGLDLSALATAARHLALDAAALTTVRALADHKIDSMLLKGPAVAWRLYPDDPDSRSYSDVDILVAPACFAQAQAALASRGYDEGIPGARPDGMRWHERPWRVPGEVPLTIDLHRSFAGVRDADAFWRELWFTREGLLVAGTRLPVPGEAAAALLLALHAAAPGGSSKPRRELSRAVAVLPPELWTAAAAVAERTGSRSGLALGLGLDAAGADVAARLALPTMFEPLDWLRAHPASRTAMVLATVAALPTTRARLVHLYRRAAPPAGVMRYRDPEARGRCELVRGHVRLLVNLAWGVPRGISELRTARAQARGATALRHPARAALRAARRGDVEAWRSGVWALQARWRVRRQLRRGPLREVRLPAAPRGGAATERVVSGALRWSGASCLERELVRQQWFASQGSARVLVIGVTAPSTGFRAHAWLEGDSSAQREDMESVVEHPAPSTQHPAKPRGLLSDGRAARRSPAPRAGRRHRYRPGARRRRFLT